MRKLRGMDWFTTGDFFNKEVTLEAQGLKVIFAQFSHSKVTSFCGGGGCFRLVAYSPNITLISFEVMVVLNSC